MSLDSSFGFCFYTCQKRLAVAGGWWWAWNLSDHIYISLKRLQASSMRVCWGHVHAAILKHMRHEITKKPLQKHNLNLILASLPPRDFLSWTKLPAVFGSFVSICISIAHCIPFVDVIIKFVVISFSFFVSSFFSFVLCKASMCARSSHRIRLPCSHFPFCCFPGEVAAFFCLS